MNLMFGETCYSALDCMQPYWTIAFQGISLIVGSLAAWFGIRTYLRNSKLERARWLTQLYEKFYLGEDFKRVRNLLDSEPPDSVKIQAMVKEEGTEFTDYLNFFEYIAYLKSIKQLKKDDVNALFQFYLQSLKNHAPVRAYIHLPKNGYQHLDQLLSEA